MQSSTRSNRLSENVVKRVETFLANKKNANLLLEIVSLLDTNSLNMEGLHATETVFTALLTARDMYVKVVPLKPTARNPETQYKQWLKGIYEQSFRRVLEVFNRPNLQSKGLSVAMNLLGCEGRYPLEAHNRSERNFPVNRLKLLLASILVDKVNSSHLINRFSTDYLQFRDVMFFTWKILPSITARTNPNETYILNYLRLLEELPVSDQTQFKRQLCLNEDFVFNETVPLRAINKLWQCVMHWQHTGTTHKQMLIVLLERIMPHLDKPIILVDFLMDSLDVGGAVSLLALQGIFNLVHQHNLNYPNIFTKLYSMFEPEIFHTKYKQRLFHLADIFMSSTHLPETLVAAFVKRLARLALLAPSQDIIIICVFIGNLIVRHPGLKCLLNNSNQLALWGNSDPYIMDESDPMKSNAIQSSLWEIESLQSHVNPEVAQAARFINTPLATTEHGLGTLIQINSGQQQMAHNELEDLFDKELRKHCKLFVIAFSKPHGARLESGEQLTSFWNL